MYSCFLHAICSAWEQLTFCRTVRECARGGSGRASVPAKQTRRLTLFPPAHSVSLVNCKHTKQQHCQNTLSSVTPAVGWRFLVRELPASAPAAPATGAALSFSSRPARQEGASDSFLVARQGKHLEHMAQASACNSSRHSPLTSATAPMSSTVSSSLLSMTATCTARALYQSAQRGFVAWLNQTGGVKRRFPTTTRVLSATTPSETPAEDKH
jgi:hypothetical protein